MIWEGEAIITRDEIIQTDLYTLYAKKGIPLTDDYVVSMELLDDKFNFKWVLAEEARKW